jgi:CHAT domain-containing protein/tetratricopeptide (TPR) repeat protein
MTMRMTVRKPRSLVVFGTAATLAATGMMFSGHLFAQQPKQPASKMTVEQAKKIAAGVKSAYAPPPRSIDDIAKILEQSRPDPKKVAALVAVADAPAPAGISGFAAAEFYNKRGLAARDLGRTQQRIADMREMWKHAKPFALRNVSTPAPGQGAGGGGGQGKWVDPRGPDAPAKGLKGTGGGGGPGNFFANMSHAERRAWYNSYIPHEVQRASRMLQSYVNAEADAGNYQIVINTVNEVAGPLTQSRGGIMMTMYARVSRMYLKLGDLNAARQWLGRAQQQNAVMRGRNIAMVGMYFNSWNSILETAQADIDFASGKFAEAEQRYRNGIRLQTASMADRNSWFELPDPGQMESAAAIYRLLLGNSLARQGKLVEAEVEIRQSLLEFLKLQGDAAPNVAGIVGTLSDVLLAQGRYKDALRLAEISDDLYVKNGVDPQLRVEAMQRVAAAHASQGRWEQAMKIYDGINKVLEKNPAAQKRYRDGNLVLAVAMTRSGQAAAAIPILEDIVKKRVQTHGEQDGNVAEARGFLGAALALAGRDEEAAQILRSAIPVLLNSSVQTAQEEGDVDSQRRKQEIVDSYFTLLTRIRGTDTEKKLGIDATDEAFRMADIAHAKSVHTAIAASSARAAGGEAGLSDLIRQTQDTDQQINSLSDLLKAQLNAAADVQTAGAVAALRKDIAQLQEARRTLRREIEKRFPQYAALINPKPVGIAEARARLRADEALVVTYYSGGKGYAWAVPKEGDVAFGSIGIDESDAVRTVDALLKALNPAVDSITKIPAFDVASAHKLHKAILDPVAGGWKSAKHVIVVGHGALGRLPFTLLVTKPAAQPEEKIGAASFAGYRDVPFLVRDTAVTHIPSVAALMSLRGVAAASPNRKPFIGFGDPWFSPEQADEARQEQAAQLASASNVVMRAAPATGQMESADLSQLPRLPDTAAEVKEIAKVMGAGEADIILGARASEQNVRSMKLDDRKVVMFATHGLVPGELDGLTQPALALSSPAVAGVQGDGLLTVEEILGLKLDADWVVLSACNTASGDASNAEAVSGLGRAFFYAGARALLVTHWPVETASARKLTTDLFRRQAERPELSRAEALREAMLDMIQKGEIVEPGTGKPVFAYAHPIFWSPFAIVGDGGGGTPRN